MNAPIYLKKATPLILISFLLGCFALSPVAQAVVPAPDGGYPNNNTAEGDVALLSLTTGADNTAVGLGALASDLVGSDNTAVGTAALVTNTASRNTGIGSFALFHNTDGSHNTATGFIALEQNIGGSQNTGNGEAALFSNQSGNNNTATGYQALVSNVDTDQNTADGAFALTSHTSGDNNTAIGVSALQSHITGENNVALGLDAGFSLTTGDGNVYLGEGMFGTASENNHTYIRNIKDTSVSGGGTDTVTINLTTGLVGHLSSSRRYKEEIKPMARASEALYRLKPVSYRYRKEIDSIQSPSFGLIAEEVAEVNPALVARNSEGQPESVHYEMVNAMLLNEFLKEHKAFVEEQRKVQKQGATIARLKQQVQALTAGLQKVSAQLELGKSAPRTVLNDQ